MLANARAALLARFALPADDLAPSSSRGGLAPPPPPSSNALPWLAGGATLAALMLGTALGLRRTVSGEWQLWQAAPVPPAAAEAAAAIGLPPQALRPHYSAVLPQELARQQQAAQQAARKQARRAAVEQQPPAPAQVQVQVAPISKDAAARLIGRWLVS